MFKKFATTVVVVAGLASAAIVSATPAAAMSDGEAAAIGLGAFAVGAVATGAMGGGYHQRVIYHDCYSTRRPVYNHWGDVVGFRSVQYCD
jgi:hypothetical protein